MLFTHHFIEQPKFYSDLTSNQDLEILSVTDVYSSEKDPSETLTQPVEAEIANSPEQSNHEMAKTLDTYRTQLIHLIAQLPLTALYLLQKHEQKLYNTDDDTDNLSEIADQLCSLSATFQIAQQSAMSEGLDSAHFMHIKLQLAEQLSNFVFTAEQLKKISALIIYAALQSRIQSKSTLSKQHKAFEKILHLSNLNAVQLKKELNQLGVELNNHALLSQFLMPGNTVTPELIDSIMQAEQQWLKCRQKLAESNTRLVFYIANQYKGSFLDFNDLVQEGQSGLLKAVDRFDYERGFQFSTYAAYWIRQAISRALSRNERVVRLPFGKMADVHKVNRAKHQLYAQLGNEPSIKEISDYTGLAEADVSNVLIIAQPATSLDTPIDEDDGSTTKADFLEQQVYSHPLNKIAETELSQLLRQAINFLSDKEAQVINCRFGINAQPEMTLEEIGSELHLTRERVRQIQIAAIQKMKRHFGSQLSIFL